jgi:hypothetical protein
VTQGLDILQGKANAAHSQRCRQDRDAQFHLTLRAHS